MKIIAVMLLPMLLAACVNLHVHFPPAAATGETPAATTP